MKRYIHIMALLVAVFGLSTKAQADNYTLSIDAVEIAAGGTANVELRLSNASGAYTACQFDVVLPEGLSLKTVTPNNVRMDGHQVSTHQDGNVVTVALFSANSNAIKNTSGTLLSFTLVADKAYATESTTVTVENAYFVTTTGVEERYSSVVEGEIGLSHEAVLLGDVNGDGEITPIDITLLISYYLEQNPKNFDERAADLNGDGVVTPIDITLLISKYLSE